MIKYSARAAKALGYLKRAYNDLEIFVEDTASQAIWMRIIAGILPRRAKLRSVNMLGGRENVIKACRLDQGDDGRKKLYIIDGDFDYIRGKPKQKLRHLYRLRAYCVENLLVEEKNLIEIALDSDPKCSVTDAKATIEYANYIGNCEYALKKLFTIYAAAYELRSNVKTVGYSVKNFLESSKDAITISPSKIHRRCREIIRILCKNHSIKVVRETRKRMERNALRIPFHMAVSGKDYLLPFVHLHMTRRCGFRGTEAQLKSQLARNFSPQMEPYFVRRVRMLAA